MTKFIFVRHGQSEGNAVQKFLGHTDMGLTQLGHEQARKTAEYLKDMGIDVIYTSDLIRAYDTAMCIGKVTGLIPVKSSALREIYAGKWEGMNFQEIADTYPEYETWLSDIGNAVCTDGESVRELQKRINNEIVKIARLNDGKTVCIATHGTPLRVMSCIWQNLDISEAKNIPWVSNASVTTVTYDSGVWKAESIGYDEHLTGLISKLPANV